MFGYVVINKPEMKIKDYDRYRMYYCGVCRALKDRYGVLGQAALTYDAAFAAALITALYEPAQKSREVRCVLHPVDKRKYLVNGAVNYMADMNMLLAYYKCLDDWADDRNIAMLSYGCAIRSRVRKTAAKYRDRAAGIRRGVLRISKYERKKNGSIDDLAKCFGEIMRTVLTVSPRDLSDDADNACAGYICDWSEALGEFGYHLGRFIYIMDAYDDVADDVANGKFNPLADKYKSMTRDELAEWVKRLLMLAADDMAKAYERLPIVGETSILRNVIYSGIWIRFYQTGKVTRYERPISCFGA